jgi:hypothetical protein
VVRITGVESPVAKDHEDMWLLTDLSNPLEEWQRDEALGHWKGLSSLSFHCIALTNPFSCSNERSLAGHILGDILIVFAETEEWSISSTNGAIRA